MREEWKKIDGFPDYEVSNIGRIKSYKRGCQKIRRQSISHSGNGYPCVNLRLNKKPKCLFVHKIVANAFVENPHKKINVNHIDGNKKNNHYDNLEWVTKKENIRHAIESGLMKIKEQGGVKNHMSNIDEHEVLDIYNTYMMGFFTQREISNAFNVSLSVVCRIVNKKSYTEVLP